MAAVKFNFHFSNEAVPSEGSGGVLGESTPVTPDSPETIPDRDSEEIIFEEIARTHEAGRRDPFLVERKLFIGNYEFIWENRERILNDEALSESQFNFAGYSLAYLGGGCLTVGMLLTLWNNGEWTSTCPFCGGTVRIYGWGGSPLTGRNKYHGFCTSCKRDKDDAEDYFLNKVLPAMRMVKERNAKFAEAYHPKTTDTPKVVHSDFRTLSKKWTEYEKHPEKISVSKPKKTMPKNPEERIWYSRVQLLLNRLNNKTL
ncbi:hypothetical protein [Aminivibrio sp.]|uniref:hypothetical protein n=1 Tax=Aminivibrio sp. TaxID=1872489 RepID=UPI00345E7C5E